MNVEGVKLIQRLVDNNNDVTNITEQSRCSRRLVVALSAELF